jgi:nucleoid-associated protein YgaU
MIMWGSIEIRRCVLKGASIAYKLFRADGTPIRAVITANFTENVDDATRVATERKSSPDVTHMRVVKAGDTLPLLSFKIYGDKKYYLELARVNGLDHFTRLEPGQEIYFPPLEKAAKKVIPM